MAIINEGVDTNHSSGMGTANVLVGDTFNGTLGGSDTIDGVNLAGLTLGQTYTVSFTVDDLAGFTGLQLMDQFIYTAAAFSINNGVISGGAQDFGSANTSALRIDGNTVSFEFTPVTRGSASFRIEGDGSLEAYSLTLTEYVEFPNITEGDDIFTAPSEGADVSLLGGDDTFEGGAGIDIVNGDAGKDKLTGRDGNDVLNGGDGNDLLAGDGGNDILDGGRDNDRMYGGAGNDVMTGGHGNDLLDGGDGNDILTGGVGKDTMTGGAGNDVFVFEIGSHRDTISDFGNGNDVLDFSGYVGVNSFADLSISQSGAHTVISAGGPQSVTLLDTDASTIGEFDFIF